jgi:hypothetical protein
VVALVVACVLSAICGREKNGGRMKEYHDPRWWGYRIIAPIFNWHGRKSHNADYEVCPNWLCRLARWMEEVL